MAPRKTGQSYGAYKQQWQHKTYYASVRTATSKYNPDDYVVKISNGDTPDWAKITANFSSPVGKIVKAVTYLLVAPSDRTFDSIKFCIYVHSDLLEPLIQGLKTALDMEFKSVYTLINNFEKTESFDEFFTQNQIVETKARDKKELLKLFATLTESPISDNASIIGLKPIYRKAALRLHPDRNNGDGSKMSELNSIWAELQPMLKESVV